MLFDFCRCFQVTATVIDPLQHLAAVCRASSHRDELLVLRPNRFGHCKTTNPYQLHRLDLQWLSIAIGPLCLHMAPSAGMKLLRVAPYTVFISWLVLFQTCWGWTHEVTWTHCFAWATACMCVFFRHWLQLSLDIDWGNKICYHEMMPIWCSVNSISKL